MSCVYDDVYRVSESCGVGRGIERWNEQFWLSTDGNDTIGYHRLLQLLISFHQHLVLVRD
jgi:hypothetical protein